MTWTWTPARRGGGQLLLGIAGPSGSGKTCSALRVGTGLAEILGGPLRVLDTESGRARHYADTYSFEHADFPPPWSSARYAEAVTAAAQAGTRVLVIDSASHEHDGQGGLLDAHEAELERLAGDDQAKRARCTAAAWIRPKRERHRWVQTLLHCGIPAVILCYRAEPKIDWSDTKRPTEIGVQPIGGGGVVYELTARILLRGGGEPEWQGTDAERRLVKLPGYLGWLQQQRGPLTEETGRALARWLRGEQSAAEALLARYADARTVEEWRACEGRRAELWRDARPEEKRELKAASDAAKERIGC